MKIKVTDDDGLKRSGDPFWHMATVGWLQRAREVALLMGAAAYPCGYLTRAVFAHNYDLGLISALDLQYFVAGSLHW
jgi:hypothetical protein